ncbi:hypothetical protein [Streptomyces sp. SYSU K217416]
MSLDLTDGDDVEPDVAVAILEPASALLGGLTDVDRRALADMLVEFAELEEDPVAR